MYLLPFSRKLNKGTYDVFAVGNTMPSSEPLMLVKFDVSASKPVLVKVYTTKESNIADGEDITPMMVSSNSGKQIQVGQVRVFGGPVLEEDGSLVKTMYVKDKANVFEEIDNMVLETQSVVVVRFITGDKTIVTGNLTCKARKMFE